MKKISIIVPVYNVELYLDRCMESIVNQTYKNIEIIVVDDGATDRSPELCDIWQAKDSRIKVIHKENGGLSDARNVGIDIATGDYILFVDSDDYVSIHMCEKLANVLDDDVDIVSYHFKRFTDNTILDNDNGTGEIIELLDNDIFKDYIERKNLTHMVTDKMFRLSLFENTRFIKGRLAEDLAICYQLVSKAKKIKCLDEAFYYYYTRTDSIMGNASLKLTTDAFQGECEAFEYGNSNFPKLCVENNVRFLNQSMKVYLKLIFYHNLPLDDSNVIRLEKIINSIEKKHLPIKTLLFYICLKISRRLAWEFYKIFKLT